MLNTFVSGINSIKTPADLFDIHGKRKSAWRFKDIPSMKGKNVIVTGANSGLGFEVTRHLANAGAHIIMAVRTNEHQQGLDAMAHVLAEFPYADLEMRDIELTDRNSVHNFATGILKDFDHLDILVNNAGIGTVPPSLVEGWDHVLWVNSVAPFLLTGLLLPLIKQTKGARVVFVGSVMYEGAKDFHRDELRDMSATSVGARNKMYGYSKLANIFMAKELAKRFDEAGFDIVVAAAHPGGAATPLNSRPGNPMRPIAPLINAIFQSAEMGAAPLLFAATDPSVNSGDYIGPAGLMRLKGWPMKENLHGIGRDEEVQANVIKFLEEASNFKYDFDSD